MHCTGCGAAIGTDAKFCGGCGRQVGGAASALGTESKSWGCLVALGIVGFVWLTGQCSPEVPKETVAAVDPAPCDRLIEQGQQAGLVKARPSANRIDVEDVTWRQMPAASKRGMALAVRCSYLRGATGREDFDSYAVVYGYRSGKRLAMVTQFGASLE